jgi:hypothetical protein
MVAEGGMTEAAGQELIYLNGISGETGTYAVEPVSLTDFANAAKNLSWGSDHWNDLQTREFYKQDSFQILPQYGDGSELKKARWGIVFPASADLAQVDSILAALEKLISLRETQMGQKAKIFRGGNGFRWLQPPLVAATRPETKNEWLSRNGAGPGQVDPTIVPYYLLIIGDPLSIPYVFQTELDVQYAVGRLYFNTLEEYTRYAESVVAAAEKVKLARKAVFFGVANPGDKATALSAEHFVKPLNKYVNDNMPEFGLGWEAELVEGDNADKSTLTTLLGGSQAPALLFTASHGINFSYMHPDQYRYQGALVCRDWKGPYIEPATRQHYLAAEDIPDTNNLLGSVVFHFACFGAGTPYWDDFAIAKSQNRKAIAGRPFIASLPNRLLSLPGGGALAVIGHIDRAWNYSFQWSSIEEQNTAYQGILFQLMAGKPVGLAMESMNDRYSEIATMLANTLQDLRYTTTPTQAQLARAAFEFANHNDARGYAVLGDPAACIPLAPLEESGSARPAIQITHIPSGKLPVVFDPDSLNSLNEAEREAVQNEEINLPCAVQAAGSETRPQAPVQEIVSNQPAPTPAGPPTTGSVHASSIPIKNETIGRPFSTPIDGLAFALQSYTSQETVSFSIGEEGVSFNILDDAKDKIKDVVVSLNNALGNLAKKLEHATSDLATLQVITGVVDDLETFDPKSVERRIVTQISASGDIQVFLPRGGSQLDEDLLALHQSMVRQALSNRLEVAQAVTEMISGLFGGQK